MIFISCAHAYIHQWTLRSLVCKRCFHLFVEKPLTRQMPISNFKTPRKHILLKINRTILCLFQQIPLKKEHGRWDRYFSQQRKFHQYKSIGFVTTANTFATSAITICNCLKIGCHFFNREPCHQIICSHLTNTKAYQHRAQACHHSDKDSISHVSQQMCTDCQLYQ